MTVRILRIVPLILILLPAVSLAAPPALDDPLIKGIMPVEGQAGMQVLITGVNFGSSPVVRFNGVAATVDVNRTDMGRIVATVPSGATSGPVTVRNPISAKTSNGAEFTVLPGTYTPVCTITGTVTDPSTAAVPNALVVAIDPVAGLFAGMDDTDGSGAFSIGLDAAGSYQLNFVPPHLSGYSEAGYTVSCSGTQNHQFADGHRLHGRVLSDVPAAIENVWVTASGTLDYGMDTLTDGSGNFEMYVPTDTYKMTFQGPVGGNHVATELTGITVTGDTNVGDVTLDTGVLVSGTVRFQDGADTGPVMNGEINEYDFDGFFRGSTVTIADGSFWLPSPTGPGFVLFVDGNSASHVELFVFSLAVSGDMNLDYPLTVYSRAPQVPQTPLIAGIDSLNLQAGQRIILDAAHLRGSTGSVRFSDGMGGTVDGVDTVVEADRGGVVTTVPATADTGDVVIRIDGVDSPGYPVTVSGTYNPGPYTTSGIVDDGSSPVPDVFVGIFRLACYQEHLVDYDLTAGDGSYSVEHGAGDHYILFLPPVTTGLASAYRELPGLVGGGTQNVTLQAGHAVTARCIDSGIGPVGGSDPIPDCSVSAEEITVDSEDSDSSDGTGDIRLNLLTGTYEFYLEAPFRSRFIHDDGGEQTITADIDFGDIEFDSGYFIEGRVVDPLGDPLPGVEVYAVDTASWQEAGYTATVGPDGSFLLPVPPSIYDLYFEVHPDLDYFVPPLFRLEVFQDYLAYPAVEALEVGQIQGTVTDTFATAVGGVPVSAWHDTYGVVDGVQSCEDGTYSLRAPSGDFSVRAAPSNEGYCLADEHWNNHYAGCGADPVTVTSPNPVPGIDFTLEPAGDVSGMLTDDSGSGVGGITVCAINGASLPFCSAPCTLSNADGTYTVRSVRTGNDYRIQADGSGYPLECWQDHVNCLSYDPVTVNNCVTTTGIDFLMSGAPGRVPDGKRTPGTMMTADYDSGTNTLTVFWQPTCSADNHATFFGSLGNFSTYTNAECVMGVTGAHPMNAPAGDLFFVVVGVNSNSQGSFGADDDLVERPSDGGALCGYAEDLSATCIP